MACKISKAYALMRCVHDQGFEFIGAKFQRGLHLNSICNLCITPAKNPQANSICEHMHQTVGNILCTLLDMQPIGNVNQAQYLINSALATASHATRCAIHCTLQISPGTLVFHDCNCLLTSPSLPILNTFDNNNNSSSMKIFVILTYVDCIMMT